MNEFFVHYFFNQTQTFLEIIFTAADFQAVNRAFLLGDAVKASFFVRNGQLMMAEECYFFLMSSMRKMRMNIPLSFTLEFFLELFQENVLKKGFENGIIQLMTYRNKTDEIPSKAEVSYFFQTKNLNDLLSIQDHLEMDLIKEINVNTNLLSNIRVHCPENVYAEIYARENDLDDVILLNPNKRIARSIYGNLLFLEGSTIKIPNQSEGAFISPLMENFVTFIHRRNLAEILESEMIGFESQKAEEILMISDEIGIFSVAKIRTKTFGNSRFSEWVESWRNSLL